VMNEKNIIAIKDALYKVTITRTMMTTKDFCWKAETLDNIGFTGNFYDNNHNAVNGVYEITDTPEKAFERFKRFAKLNGITKYEVDLEVKIMLKA